MSPTTPSASAMSRVWRRISPSASPPSGGGGSTPAEAPGGVGGRHPGRVARVDPGLLDVLHDPADPDVLAVAQRVDVDLDRVLHEAVEEDLAVVAGGAAQVVARAVDVVHDLHRAAAEDVRRAHEQRPADLGRGGDRLV